jgi:O-antigen ligase
MYPTPALWFELGVAALIALAILWAKVEIALFLYAFALGFPDVALPLGSAVNLRVDDVLLLILLLRIVFWLPAPLSRSQRSILVWQGIFFALCVFSIVVESAQGSPPETYDAARMAGCAAILLVLPRVLQSQTRLRSFVAGLACAGIALAIQVRGHIDANGAGASNFQQLKSAATFETWNPNTIGQAAILLVAAAGLGWIVFSGSLAGKILWPSFASVFALLPAFVFARGSTLSIAAGLVLFLCLLRRWKSLLVFTAVCLGAILYLSSCHRQMVVDASSINLAMREGFSSRFDRWGIAIHGIEAKPIVGQGFGQELAYLSQSGSEGRAHDDLLSVWLELGLGGVCLFLSMMFQFGRAGWRLYSNPRCERQGALIVALLLALCLDSLGLPTLYWEKLPIIALSLMASLIGVCERDDLDHAVRELRAIPSEPFAQFADERLFPERNSLRDFTA